MDNIGTYMSNIKYEHQSIFRTLNELKDLGSKTIKNIDRFKSYNSAVDYFNERGLGIQGYRKNYKEGFKEYSEPYDEITCEEWLNLEIPNIAYMHKRRPRSTDVMSVCMINTIYDLAQLMELDKIETVMCALSWSWWDTGIPNKKQILYRAIETLVEVVDALDLEKLSNQEQTGFVTGIGGGGFNAELHAYYKEDYGDTDILSSFESFCIDDIKIDGKPVMFTMSLTFELSDWSLDTPRVFNPNPIDLLPLHSNTGKITTCSADDINNTDNTDNTNDESESTETDEELKKRTTVYLHSQLNDMGMVKDCPVDVLYDLLDKVITPNCIKAMAYKSTDARKSLAREVYEYVSSNKGFIEYAIEYPYLVLGNAISRYSDRSKSQT